METIANRIIQLKEQYAETEARLASVHPAWDKKNDVRLTVFYKIASVLDSTQIGLVVLINDLLYEDWWRRNSGLVPSHKAMEGHAEGFDTFCKWGCLFGAFSMSECSLRQIARAIDPGACSGGTAEFASVVSWLLTRLSLQKHESLMDLLRFTRNTLHNNGAFFHRSGCDKVVVHNGDKYEFFTGKYVDFLSWDFLLNRFSEVREFLENLVTAREVESLSRIDDL